MSKFVLAVELNKNIDEEKFKLQFEENRKFQNDCIYSDREDYFLLLDGVVLNKKRLMKSAGTEWESLIIDLYRQRGETFFELLRGSFVGLLFDKKLNNWLIFTDHIGSKPIYYHQKDDKIYFSNDFTKIVNYLKASSTSISLNIEAAYLLLTYGYVFEDITIISEISRLMIGYYGLINNYQFEEKKFFELNNDPVQIDEDEAIEEMDKRFRNAIELSFSKDQEYNYKHLVSLSGGLDSRMTSWVSHDMGYTDQLNITFSQSGYLDETIPKKIASDLKHEWLFKALDNGTFLKSVDEINYISGGNVLYFGLAHSYSLFRYLNFSDLGLLHTGQLGDVIISSYASSPSYNQDFSTLVGSYSEALKDKVQNHNFNDKYTNEELFKLNIRGLYGMNLGLLPIQKFTETYSPFYDVDFMNFTLRLPIKMRFKHRLYKKWILKKYPEAADYIWESKKAKLTDWHIRFRNYDIPLKQLFPRILKKIGFEVGSFQTKNQMNPLEYWYQTNTEIKNFQDRYFHEHISHLNMYSDLKKDCIKHYKKGTALEKNQTLTLLSALKLYLD